MSKQHTLFSFFKKVPSPSVRDAGSSPNTAISDTGNFVTPKKVKSDNEEYKICTIIWAKLDGFPWWPSMICQHPKSKKHIILDEVHVQFFDRPPTRAWIKKKFIQPYDIGKGDDKREPKNCKAKELELLKLACEDADKAVAASLDARADLLVDFSQVPPTPEKSDKEGSPGTDKENEDGNAPPAKKQKLFNFDSGDSEDDYQPDGKESEEEEDDDESSGVDSAEEEPKTESELEESLEDSPPKRGVKRKRPQPPRGKAPSTPAATPSSAKRPAFSTPVGQSAKARLSLFKSTPSTPKNTTEDPTGNWPHLKLDFLQPDKIMDKNRRRPDHPDYDARTLHVPDTFKNGVTPAVRQWWELKSDHYDCVLFFKVGKFYELYHMDAVIGVNELSLTFMRGEFAHSGFPEIAYGRFSTILVQKGYKVARVEQTETPDMMAERCRAKGRTSKFDKVVSREICQLTTRGTQVFSFLDGEAKESETNYLLALTEKFGSGSSTYGVCFIDTSIGTFHVGQFTDDKYSSRLRTLVSHRPPVQVLYERGRLSPKTTQFLKTSLASVLLEPLVPDAEFWSASKTLTTLAEGKYFHEDGRVVWPQDIRRFISDADSLGLTPSDDGDLALRALGACVWYLQRSLLDQQILAMKMFEQYVPVDGAAGAAPLPCSMEVDEHLGRYMVVDGITLANLEVLVNSTGGRAGTLLAKLDRCCTFSGKRLLRQWVCSPLCDSAGIAARQVAVTELLDKPHLMQDARALLKQIPDLERLFAKIHTQGNVVRSQTHPDSRAILFEGKIYSKRKIQDFLSTLRGFEQLVGAMAVFQKEDGLESSLLRQCTLHPGQGKFPDIREHLKFFEEAFDHELAKAEGCIIPRAAGLDREYDEAMEELSSIERDLKDYLKSQCQYFGVQVKYFGTDKNRYQLEIAESQVKKAGSEYEFTSSRKGYKRFTTSRTKALLKRQLAAEESKAGVLKDLSRRVFAQFGERHGEWSAAMQCMAVLDVLLALAEYSRTEEGDTCVPRFEAAKGATEPWLEVREGRHPCIAVADGFIPNDTVLGTAGQGALTLLTGPNMGGKSTLMRQLGLLVVMAHLGCRVPAVACSLTPVDRIFTRLGAQDDILAGESTFLVELNEAALFLNHASRHALVLVDELGRGTSTYDGTAIAFAVVRELAARRCRTLFSTHYHTLVEDLKHAESVSLAHMACMVETDEEDPSEETVTFLYKLAAGPCPKSHGFNAAKLAGVPLPIVKVGREKAAVLEREAERRRLFRALCGDGTSEDLARHLQDISLVLQ